MKKHHKDFCGGFGGVCEASRSGLEGFWVWSFGFGFGFKGCGVEFRLSGHRCGDLG